MRQHKPDLIKLAVEAAGGRSRVADMLGLRAWTVTNWQRQRRVPVQYLRALCAAGCDVITVDQLLDYMEESRAETVVHRAVA